MADATISDLDELCLKTYLLNRFAVVMAQKGINEQNLRDYTLEQMTHFVAGGVSVEGLMRNLRFIRPDGKLTVAAMLLFGKYPQRWLPAYTAKCISYVGNSVGGTRFRDKVKDTNMEGHLRHQYETIMAFFTRNLRNVQVEKEFNSQGKLEISYAALVEFVVNALVHRSLNWKVPIRIFIFDNRAEIHSPGELPNGLTVDDIVKGTSMPRNQFLFTNANYLLPYTGAGSGILRALEEGLDVMFKNEERIHEFVIIIKREPGANDQEGVQETNGVTNEVANGVTNEVNSLKVSLTSTQKDILNFCSVPRTAKEILERLGLTNQTYNRKKHIQPLLDLGVLEMINPENPNASNQKYRKKKK